MNVKQEITDLTVCRAFFAAWVFIYHVDLHAQFSAYLGPFGSIIHRGYLGVDGFFLLSGLILARVHPELGKSPQGAIRFWLRRLARIYPVHLATILLLMGFVALSAAMGFTPRDPQRFTNAELVQNLLLVHGWGFSDHWAWNYPSWSISTEWAGYLLFPVLALFLGLCPDILVAQLGVLCIPILGLIAYSSGVGLNATFVDALPRFFPEFIWGMATARLVPVVADNLPTRGMAISGAIIILLALLISTDVAVLFGLWLVLAGLTMHADAERPPLFRNNRVLRWLGKLSYAYYMSFALSEMLLAQLFRRLAWDPAGHMFAYAGAMTLLTFMLAVILHMLVEVPCRRFADHLLDAPRPLAVAAQRL